MRMSGLRVGLRGLGGFSNSNGSSSSPLLSSLGSGPSLSSSGSVDKPVDKPDDKPDDNSDSDENPDDSDPGLCGLGSFGDSDGRDIST